MSFRGKIVDKKETDTPIGKITITKKEYDSFPKRKKIIWWMGYTNNVTGMCKLGELITTSTIIGLHFYPRFSSLDGNPAP